MNYSSSLTFMAKILWIGAVGMFVVAEMVVVLAIWKIPNDHLFMGLGTKCFIVFIVALPMVAGMNGYYSARRRLSSASDELTTALSVQFLITIVTAYVALLLCVGPLATALQPFLK